jgi:uncharacterized protein (TIGR03437 family)
VILAFAIMTGLFRAILNALSTLTLVVAACAVIIFHAPQPKAGWAEPDLINPGLWLGTPLAAPGTASAKPTISGVLDAGRYSPNIAQGSVFVVQGSGLSASGYVTTSFPLPPSYDNVEITFTPFNGGNGVQAYLIYLYNETDPSGNTVNQLAAILPSTVSPGVYEVTVTNSGVMSAPFVATVVAAKPALITQDSSGEGLVVAQNYVSSAELDVNRFTTGSADGATISPAHPDQTLIAYLTGLGPISGPDNQPAPADPADNFLSSGATVQVYVGGMAITPFYAGRTPGSAGLDQIDFTLPANVPTGCTVAFQVSENGVLSQVDFISIAPTTTASACVQTGYTTSQLQNLDNGGLVYSGEFSLGTSTTAGATSYAGFGQFNEFTGYELAAAVSPTISTIGPTECAVTQIQPNQNQISTVATGFGVALDAGTVTLTGPGSSNITNQAFLEGSDVYNLPFLSGKGSLTAGTYTLTGSGGASVGPFTATVTLGAPFNVTGGLPTTVNRNSGLNLSWTGGNSSDVVVISGTAATGSGANETGASFLCFTTAGQGTFTVPASILGQLPAVTSTQTGAGTLSVTTRVSPSSGDGLFTAPLTGGGSISDAVFVGTTSTSGSAAYQ